MIGGFVFTNKQNSISSVKPQSGNTAIGQASSIFYNRTLKGEPRFDNLFLVRLLGQTPYVEMMKDTIKKQISSMELKVKPPETIEKPSEQHLQAAAEIKNFFMGNYNTNHDTWDALVTATVDDILDFDSGVWELIPNDNGFLSQIIIRDGLTMTKNPRTDGLLPGRDDDEPAYFQFSNAVLHTLSQNASQESGIDIESVRREVAMMPYVHHSIEAIPFTRDQIVWFSESPVSYSSYGRGRTQKVKKLAEVIINGDFHRNRYFLENEFHKGFLQLNNGTQPDISKLQDVFGNSKGNEYEIPIVGGTDASWISIDPTPDKMQFLESHKWYITALIMAYGGNESEAGLHENANLSVSDEMKYNMYRRTTLPLLRMIEHKINSSVLPFMEAYNRVNGELIVEFDRDTDFIRRMRQQIEKDDLSMGIKTLNELRRERGDKDFGELGNLPDHVLRALAQTHPGWVAEQINPNITNTPTPLPPTLSIQGNDDDKDSGLKKKSKFPETKEIRTYRQLFSDSAEVEKMLKEPLRNDRTDFPPLVSHINGMKKKIGKIISGIEDSVISEAKKRFPEEESDGNLLIDTNSITENINLEGMEDTLIEENQKALQKSAEHKKTKLENDINKRYTLPTEAKIAIGDFDITQTFTWMMLQEEAAQHVTDITSSVRDNIKRILLSSAKKGSSIGQVTESLREKIKEMSESHAELIARTETLSAARDGSQALGESTDVIAGKEWLATEDARTRPWHAAMNGITIGKNDKFTVPSGWQGSPYYQPNEYPKTVRVVGKDQPFNCRCDQLNVLKEDMPDTRSLRDYNLKLHGLNHRQVEVWRDNAKKDEKSFKRFWKRVVSEKSNKQISKEMGMSYTTIQNWKKQVF